MKNNKNKRKKSKILAFLSMPGQKKGWIRIFEAVLAIFLIVIAVLVLLTNSALKREDFSQEIYNAEIFILRDIQLNNSLREEIIDSGLALPIEWDSANFPSQTKARIIEKTPSYLECKAKICDTNDLCLLTDAEGKSIYAENVIITATNTEYNPTQLKLFCWEK